MIPGIIGSGKNVDVATVRKVYNSIAIKDMSFEDFNKEIQDLTCPIKMAQDLAAIRHRPRSITLK
jgi:hypothetical protein